MRVALLASTLDSQMNFALGDRPSGRIELSFWECSAQRTAEDLMESRGTRWYCMERRRDWKQDWVEFASPFLSPPTVPPTAELICQYNDNWSVYVNNADVRMGCTLHIAMAHSLSIRTVEFISQANRKTDDPYHAYSMWFVDRTEGRDFERVVRAATNDNGRWTFYQSGEPMSFEDTSRYSLKRIRDRLPHDLLEQYANNLGLSLRIEQDLNPCYVIRRRETSA